MKKRKQGIALITIVIAVIILFISYDRYADKKKEYYLNRITKVPEELHWVDPTKEVKEIRTIKRTPTELIMLIKVGEDKAFLSVENWLTRAGDEIHLNYFDKQRSFVAYE